MCHCLMGPFTKAIAKEDNKMDTADLFAGRKRMLKEFTIMLDTGRKVCDTAEANKFIYHQAEYSAESGIKMNLSVIRIKVFQNEFINRGFGVLGFWGFLGPEITRVARHLM